MDDIGGQLEAVFWALWEKVAGLGQELLEAAWRKVVAFLGGTAEMVTRLAAKVSGLSPWLTLTVVVLLLALCVGYALRQRLFDRLLVYHLVWLRWRGFSRQVFRVRRGAVRENWQGMARRVALSERVSEVAVYALYPEHFAVAYGVAGGCLEDVRLYRRDRRAGIVAMAGDLAAYYRANVRMLHAEAELRALFGELDAVDPVFAAWRPALPGEERRPVRGVSLPGGGRSGRGRRVVWVHSGQ